MKGEQDCQLRIPTVRSHGPSLSKAHLAAAGRPLGEVEARVTVAEAELAVGERDGQALVRVGVARGRRGRGGGLLRRGGLLGRGALALARVRLGLARRLLRLAALRRRGTALVLSGSVERRERATVARLEAVQAVDLAESARAAARDDLGELGRAELAGPGADHRGASHDGGEEEVEELHVELG